MEIVQILGTGFVCIIMVCIGWTIVEYLFSWMTKPNNKLEENLKKFDKK